MRRLLFAAALLILTATAEGAPTSTRHNVLYIAYDDLRPELSLYNLSHIRTPNLQKLADTGTVFDRAYCQQTVCAPSRVSFTTGRRPNSTRTWNVRAAALELVPVMLLLVLTSRMQFLNHFRQAECTTERGVLLTGAALTSAPPAGWGCDNCTSPYPSHQKHWGFHSPGNAAQYSGGSGQCCTDCTSAGAACKGWVYHNHTCQILSSVTGRAACQNDRDHPCMSGTRGTMPTWTTLPGAFKQAGYTVLGAGKYFHDGDGGLGYFQDGKDVFPGGTGAPPQQDPASWSPGLQQFPNIAQEYDRFGYFQNSFDGCDSTGGKGFAYVDAQDELCRAHRSPSDPSGSFCNPDIPLNGSGAPGQPLCDYISYNKAIDHLRYAKKQLVAT